MNFSTEDQFPDSFVQNLIGSGGFPSLEGDMTSGGDTYSNDNYSLMPGHSFRQNKEQAGPNEDDRQSDYGGEVGTEADYARDGGNNLDTGQANASYEGPHFDTGQPQLGPAEKHEAHSNGAAPGNGAAVGHRDNNNHLHPEQPPEDGGSNHLAAVGNSGDVSSNNNGVHHQFMDDEAAMNDDDDDDCEVLEVKYDNSTSNGPDPKFRQNSWLEGGEKKTDGNKATLCCGNCRSYFVTKEKFMEHIQTQNCQRRVRVSDYRQRDNIRCTHCQCDFRSYHSFMQHQPTCHIFKKMQGSYKCPECDFKCDNVFMMRAHHKIKHKKDQKALACQTCNIKFESPSQLVKHLIVNHGSSANFPCTIDSCDFVGLTEDALIAHQADFHANMDEDELFPAPMISLQDEQSGGSERKKEITLLSCKFCEFKCMGSIQFSNHIKRFHPKHLAPGSMEGNVSSEIGNADRSHSSLDQGLKAYAKEVKYDSSSRYTRNLTCRTPPNSCEQCGQKYPSLEVQLIHEKLRQRAGVCPQLELNNEGFPGDSGSLIPNITSSELESAGVSCDPAEPEPAGSQLHSLPGYSGSPLGGPGKSGRQGSVNAKLFNSSMPSGSSSPFAGQSDQSSSSPQLNYRSELARLAAERRAKKAILCLICLEKIREPGGKDEHLIKHQVPLQDGGIGFKCSRCNVVTLKLNQLVRHIKTSHDSSGPGNSRERSDQSEPHDLSGSAEAMPGDAMDDLGDGVAVRQNPNYGLDGIPSGSNENGFVSSAFAQGDDTGDELGLTDLPFPSSSSSFHTPSNYSMNTLSKNLMPMAGRNGPSSSSYFPAPPGQRRAVGGFPPMQETECIELSDSEDSDGAPPPPSTSSMGSGRSSHVGSQLSALLGQPLPSSYSSNYRTIELGIGSSFPGLPGLPGASAAAPPPPAKPKRHRNKAQVDSDDAGSDTTASSSDSEEEERKRKENYQDTFYAREENGKPGAGRRVKYFRCQFCSNFVTKRRNVYLNHVKQLYGGQEGDKMMRKLTIKCYYCSFKRADAWKLDLHIKDNHKEYVLKCSLCDFTAGLQNALVHHNLHEHRSPVNPVLSLGPEKKILAKGKPFPAKCSLCKCELAAEKSLAGHLFSRHNIHVRKKEMAGYNLYRTAHNGQPAAQQGANRLPVPQSVANSLQLQPETAGISMQRQRRQQAASTLQQQLQHQQLSGIGSSNTAPTGMQQPLSQPQASISLQELQEPSPSTSTDLSFV